MAGALIVPHGCEGRSQPPAFTNGTVCEVRGYGKGRLLRQQFRVSILSREHIAGERHSGYPAYPSTRRKVKRDTAERAHALLDETDVEVMPS